MSDETNRDAADETTTATHEPEAPDPVVVHLSSRFSIVTFCGRDSLTEMGSDDPEAVTCSDCRARLEVGVSTFPEPTLRQRMTVRSQSPELDDRFVSSIDFPGAVVKPGAYAERSFAVGRQCRIGALSLAKGLVVECVFVKTGPDFRAVAKKNDGTDPPYTEYEGGDCHRFEGAELRGTPEAPAGWKRLRLVPELQAGLYVRVKNATADDLYFEGTLRFVEDRVPTPEHEEL